MMLVDLHCPVCRRPSGNRLVVDWPCPMDARTYNPLICGECGNDFAFRIDARGMRAYGRDGLNELNWFMLQRALSKILVKIR
jgi:hypothetical protein